MQKNHISQQKAKTVSDANNPKMIPLFKFYSTRENYSITPQFGMQLLHLAILVRCYSDLDLSPSQQRPILLTTQSLYPLPYMYLNKTLTIDLFLFYLLLKFYLGCPLSGVVFSIMYRFYIIISECYYLLHQVLSIGLKFKLSYRSYRLRNDFQVFKNFTAQLKQSKNCWLSVPNITIYGRLESIVLYVSQTFLLLHLFIASTA